MEKPMRNLLEAGKLLLLDMAATLLRPNLLNISRRSTLDDHSI